MFFGSETSNKEETALNIFNLQSKGRLGGMLRLPHMGYHNPTLQSQSEGADGGLKEKTG